MAREHCPCNGVYWDDGIASGTVCAKCGRTYKVWSGGKAEWIEDHAVARVNQVENSMRSHFTTYHRDLRIIKRVVKEMRKKKPAAVVQYFPSAMSFGVVK